MLFRSSLPVRRYHGRSPITTDTYKGPSLPAAIPPSPLFNCSSALFFTSSTYSSSLSKAQATCIPARPTRRPLLDIHNGEFLPLAPPESRAGHESDAIILLTLSQAHSDASVVSNTANVC